jgi:hypothetical protein
MDEERLLTTEEAAARLGMGKHTLEVWRMRREGPVFRKLGARSSVTYPPTLTPLWRHRLVAVARWARASGEGLSTAEWPSCGHACSEGYRKSN